MTLDDLTRNSVWNFFLIFRDLTSFFFKIVSDVGWPTEAKPSRGHEVVTSPIRGQASMLSAIPNSPNQATSGSLSAHFWQQRMPAFTSGSYPPGPGSGLSRESSRDDLTSVELEQVFEFEERFRVDRRKLELLILGRFDPIKETATDFFLKVSTIIFIL